MSRDVSLYFEEIVAACDRIFEYTRGKTRVEVLETRLTRDAVLWNLMTIGEAVKSIPMEVRAQHTDIEWRKIAGLRDVVAHQYFAIDDEIVWDVIQHKLAPLRSAVAKILSL